MDELRADAYVGLLLGTLTTTAGARRDEFTSIGASPPGTSSPDASLGPNTGPSPHGQAETAHVTGPS